jgi:signal peptidase I
VLKGLSALSWLGAILIVIALILKAVWFDMALMEHNGMAPTIVRGERVLINRRGPPELGSVAVCRHPTEPAYVVGRVAATQGMTIDSLGPKLRLDGAQVPFEPRGVTEFFSMDDQTTHSLVFGDETIGSTTHAVFAEERGRLRVRRTEVPEGKLYLLGDFRASRGQDSRAFGVVDAEGCRGTIVFRLTPSEGLPPEIAHGYFESID